MTNFNTLSAFNQMSANTAISSRADSTAALSGGGSSLNITQPPVQQGPVVNGGGGGLNIGALGIVGVFIFLAMMMKGKGSAGGTGAGGGGNSNSANVINPGGGMMPAAPVVTAPLTEAEKAEQAAKLKKIEQDALLKEIGNDITDTEKALQEAKKNDPDAVPALEEKLTQLREAEKAAKAGELEKAKEAREKANKPVDGTNETEDPAAVTDPNTPEVTPGVIPLTPEQQKEKTALQTEVKAELTKVEGDLANAKKALEDAKKGTDKAKIDDAQKKLDELTKKKNALDIIQAQADEAKTTEELDAAKKAFADYKAGNIAAPQPAQPGVTKVTKASALSHVQSKMDEVDKETKAYEAIGQYAAPADKAKIDAYLKELAELKTKLEANVASIKGATNDDNGLAAMNKAMAESTELVEKAGKTPARYAAISVSMSATVYKNDDLGKVSQAETQVANLISKANATDKPVLEDKKKKLEAGKALITKTQGELDAIAKDNAKTSEKKAEEMKQKLEAMEADQAYKDMMIAQGEIDKLYQDAKLPPIPVNPPAAGIDAAKAQPVQDSVKKTLEDLRKAHDKVKADSKQDARAKALEEARVELEKAQQSFKKKLDDKTATQADLDALKAADEKAKKVLDKDKDDSWNTGEKVAAGAGTAVAIALAASVISPAGRRWWGRQGARASQAYHNMTNRGGSTPPPGGTGGAGTPPPGGTGGAGTPPPGGTGGAGTPPPGGTGGAGTPPPGGTGGAGTPPPGGTS